MEALQANVKNLHQGCLLLIFLHNEHSSVYSFAFIEFWYMSCFRNVCSTTTIRLSCSGFVGYLRTLYAIQRMCRCTDSYVWCCLGVPWCGQESAKVLSCDSQNLNRAPSEYSSASLFCQFVRILCCSRKDNLVNFSLSSLLALIYVLHCLRCTLMCVIYIAPYVMSHDINTFSTFEVLVVVRMTVL
jgi:hypothetical protein